MKKIILSLLILISFFNTNAQLSVTASSNASICTGDTLKLISAVNCKGIQALDGSSKHYRYATVYDWDCCLFGAGVNESPYGWTVDGHYKIQYDCNGNGTVVETTGSYISKYPIGTSLTLSFGYSSNPTFEDHLTVDANCCNANGTTIFVQLTEEINTDSIINYSWSGPNGFTSTEQNPKIINATTITSGIYTITVTDYTGNTASNNVTVSINPSPADIGDTILKNGMVAYYPFIGNVNDESGNGNSGTNVGATLTNDSCGNSNGAYSFDGSSNYILIGDPVPTSLQIQNEITLSAWIYVTTYPASNTLGLIVGSQCDNCNSVGATIFLDGRTNSDGQPCPPGHIHFQIGDGSWHQSNTNSQVPLDQWVHIVATRKANEDAKIYYNGVLQPLTSVAWTGSISYTNTMFAIGKQKDYMDRYFNGKIDEVRVYNRALNETEVHTLYNMLCEKSTLSIAVKQDSVCLNGKAQIEMINSQPGMNYQLYNNGNAYGSPQMGSGDTLVFNIKNPAPTDVYTVNATDTSTGCSIKLDTAIIVGGNQSFANAGADVYTCKETRIYLTASGGCNNSSYHWSYNNLNTQTILVFPSFTTTFTVTVTNCYGCTSTDEVTVHIKNACPVDAGKDTTICSGDDVTLCANGCTTYTWFNGSHQPCITFTPSSTLSYNVTGVDSNQCPVTDHVLVTVVSAPNKPVISLSANGDSLLSNTIYGNQWYYNNVLISGDTNHFYLPTVSGNYYSVVTNKCGSDTSNIINVTIAGLNETQGVSEIKIYPNPANCNFINIEMPQTANENTLIICYITGQELIRKKINEYKSTIGISGLSKGVYFVKVINDKGIKILKFIKE